MPLSWQYVTARAKCVKVPRDCILTQALVVYDTLPELLSIDMFHDQIVMFHCFHHLKQSDDFGVVQCLQC
jgi:hypothetical protein